MSKIALFGAILALAVGGWAVRNQSVLSREIESLAHERDLALRSPRTLRLMKDWETGAGFPHPVTHPKNLAGTRRFVWTRTTLSAEPHDPTACRDAGGKSAGPACLWPVSPPPQIPQQRAGEARLPALSSLVTAIQRPVTASEGRLETSSCESSGSASSCRLSIVVPVPTLGNSRAWVEQLRGLPFVLDRLEWSEGMLDAKGHILGMN